MAGGTRPGPVPVTAAVVASVLVAAFALLSGGQKAATLGLTRHGALITAQDAGAADAVATVAVSPGTPGQVLTVSDAGLPHWAAASGGSSLSSLGPTVSTRAALHHWRLTGGSPWSDLGSGAATLTATGASWLTDRPGVSIWRGGVVNDGSPATGDRLSATTTIASGASLTLALTVGARLLPITWSGAKMLLIAWDGSTVTRNLLALLTSGADVLVSSGVAGSTAVTSAVSVDWTIPHRIVVTHNQSTGAIVLYVDGVALGSASDTGSRPALDRINVGGTAGDAFSVPTALAMVADVQVWTSTLTAAQVLTDWDEARAAMGR